MPKKFKLPKNSDTCLVIKNSDGSYVVHRYRNGLIDCAWYDIDNNIFSRLAIFFDNLYAIDIESSELTFYYLGDDNFATNQYSEPRHANRFYEFFLKHYSAYKSGKSVTQLKLKKKLRPPVSKVTTSASKLYPDLHEEFSIPEPPSLDRPLIDL